MKTSRLSRLAAVLIGGGAGALSAAADTMLLVHALEVSAPRVGPSLSVVAGVLEAMIWSGPMSEEEVVGLP